jgi:hypothetical protein
VLESKGLAFKELENFNTTLSEWAIEQDRVVEHARALLALAQRHQGCLPLDESLRPQLPASMSCAQAAFSHLRMTDDLHGALRAAIRGRSALRELHARGLAAAAAATAAATEPSSRLRGKELKTGAYRILAEHLPAARARCGAVDNWTKAALPRFKWQSNAGMRDGGASRGRASHVGRAQPSGSSDDNASAEDADSNNEGDDDDHGGDGSSDVDGDEADGILSDESNDGLDGMMDEHSSEDDNMEELEPALVQPSSEPLPEAHVASQPSVPAPKRGRAQAAAAGAHAGAASRLDGEMQTLVAVDGPLARQMRTATTLTDRGSFLQTRVTSAVAAAPVPAQEVYQWHTAVVRLGTDISAALTALRAVEATVPSPQRASGSSLGSELAVGSAAHGQGLVLRMIREIGSSLAACRELHERVLALLPDAYAASILAFRIHLQPPVGVVPLRETIPPPRAAAIRRLWESLEADPLRGSPLIGSGYLQTAEQLHVGDVRWTRADIWLNDAIIVLYFRTIKRRADLVSLDRVLVVDTLFHAALTRDVPNDKQDDKWRKLFKQFGANQDLFSATSSVESVLVPVNVGVSHWVLVHINMNLRRLEYFDSLGGSAAAVLNPVW